jgi:hypothetical protein
MKYIQIDNNKFKEATHWMPTEDEINSESGVTIEKNIKYIPIMLL